MPPEPTSLRKQFLLLAAITVAGIALRCHGLTSVSLSHFDEGVYVSSGLMASAYGPYRFLFLQPLQSPPLFPWMIAAVCRFTESGSPVWAPLISALLGAATLPLLYLIGRRLGGPVLGLTAAALLAVSDMHIAYSRMALTDASLTFWFTLAIYCAVRLTEACQQRAPVARHVLWCVATGLATGGAWNTKYNGWMALAVAGLSTALSAGAARWMLRRRGGDPRTLAVSLLWLSLAGVVAAGTYLHWYLYVQHSFPGGYQAVNANHLSYLADSAHHWPRNAWRLLLSLPALRHFGWLTTSVTAAAALAVAFCGVLRNRAASAAVRSRKILRSAAGVALLFSVFVAGGDNVWFLLTAAAAPWYVLRGDWPERLLAIWTLAFLLLAPLYSPYPRLWLPGLPAAICLALLLIRDAVGPMSPGWPGEGSTVSASPPRPPIASALLAIGLLAAIIVGLASPWGWLPTPNVWSRWTSHASYAELQRQIVEQTPADAVVLCQGQPPLVVYCPRQLIILEDEPFVAAALHAAAVRPVYLAVDFFHLHQQSSTTALDALRTHLDCLQPVAVVVNDLNIITLLNYLPPTRAAWRAGGEFPRFQMNDAAGRSVPVPPGLSEPYQNVIVLFRVDSERLRRKAR